MLQVIYRLLTDTHIGIDLKGVDATSDLQTVIDQINNLSPQPAFVLFTGDLIEGMRRENFIAEFNESMTLLSQLKSPIFMINGNHEFLNGLDLWEVYFGDRYQYSFDYHSIHVAMTSLYDDDYITQSNLTWIKDDLMNHTDQTTLFCYHYDFKGQFDDMGADYHLLGHEHSSYVENNDGYTRIVTGNSYGMSVYEPGEYRILNFHNGSLVNFPVVKIPYITNKIEPTVTSITTVSIDTDTLITSLDRGYLVVFIVLTYCIFRRKKNNCLQSIDKC